MGQGHTVFVISWVNPDERFAQKSFEDYMFEGPLAAMDEGDKVDYAACVLGLRDYVGKNGFKGVVLGLSGGIDSALCAAIAVDALGAERVRCVMLPYKYTATESLTDAAGKTAPAAP